MTYHKIIVGGGISGLISAYEILCAGEKLGQPQRVIVLADALNAPSKYGSNIVLGIDGFGLEGEPHANRDAINHQIRNALPHLLDVIKRENIECRVDMRYQLLASDSENAIAAAEWLVDNFGYKKEEFFEPQSVVKFQGFNAALETQVIGQINAPELLLGLTRAVEKHGGKVIQGIKYDRHEKQDGLVVVYAQDGRRFYSHNVPLIATGAVHLSQMQGLPVSVHQLWTIAMHVHLDREDAAKISKQPVAFCDANVDGDVFWGSLDKQDVLTIGFGETSNSDERPALVAALKDKFAELLPDLKKKYDNAIEISFGAMACTDNQLPLIGRCDGFDVHGGWCGRGLVPSVSAARSYAQWIVNGDDNNLRLYEELNITPVPSPRTGARLTEKNALKTQFVLK